MPTAAGLAAMVASPQRWWIQAGNHLDAMAVDGCSRCSGSRPRSSGPSRRADRPRTSSGIGVARQHAAERIGIDASADGVAAIPSPVTYATVETHHVVIARSGCSGSGDARIRTIPLDRERRMDVSALRAAIADDLAAGRTPIAIVGNAGDVNTGIVDDLPALAVIAQSTASGSTSTARTGASACSTSVSAMRFGDPATYDSFAVDPHKWLAAPVGTGFVVCRDGELLSRAFTIEPGALRPRAARSGRSTMAAMPRVAMGVDRPRHARLGRRLLARRPAGIAGLGGAQGDRRRGHARAGPPPPRLRPTRSPARVRGRTRARAPRGATAVDLLLPLPTSRLGGPDAESRLDALNVEVLRGLRRRGRSLPSSTRVDGRFAIRACFINPRTTLAEAEVLVEEVLAVGREVLPPRVLAPADRRRSILPMIER